jgi:DNA-binding response OmpR family regulator
MAGADEYLTKPFELDQLRAVVSRALDKFFADEPLMPVREATQNEDARFVSIAQWDAASPAAKGRSG